MRNEARFIAEAAIVLAIALALTAEHIDKTEAQALVISCCLLTLLALERVQPSRSRKYAVRGAVAFVLAFCLTLRCGHELASAFWVRTAAIPGEPWQQTFARHKEKAHALVEINLHRRHSDAPYPDHGAGLR